MPYKSFFNQCFVILFDKEINLNQLKPLLSKPIVNERDNTDSHYFWGPTLAVEYQSKSEPLLNGQVYIDYINEQWPDDMGEKNKEILAAWTMSHFGPYAFPGGLWRSTKQSWSWQEAEDKVSNHCSYVRIRLNYISPKGNPNLKPEIDRTKLSPDYLQFEAELDDETNELLDELEEKSPTIPLDMINPVEELEFMTEITLELLKHENAICYFNPNGEMLLTYDLLKDKYDYAINNQLPALTSWINIRLVNIKKNIYLMDSVGNDQLDIHDIEVLFNNEDFEFADIDNFIRSLSQYIFDKKVKIADYGEFEGPNESKWLAFNIEFKKDFENLYPPSRETLRLIPEDYKKLPKEYLPTQVRKFRWQFW